MSNSISIVTAEVERGEGEGVILTFSDGTTAAYIVEELLELRPHRERTEACNPDHDRPVLN